MKISRLKIKWIIYVGNIKRDSKIGWLEKINAYYKYYITRKYFFSFTQGKIIIIWRILVQYILLSDCVYANIFFQIETHFFVDLERLFRYVTLTVKINRQEDVCPYAMNCHPFHKHAHTHIWYPIRIYLFCNSIKL